MGKKQLGMTELKQSARSIVEHVENFSIKINQVYKRTKAAEKWPHPLALTKCLLIHTFIDQDCVYTSEGNKRGEVKFTEERVIAADHLWHTGAKQKLALP